MTLADKMNGPAWIVWLVFSVFLLLSVVLLSGHGSGLIAGFNTASKEEQKKYDKKKLCRAVGTGMAVIALLCLIIGLFNTVLPYYFIYITFGTIIADVVVIIMLKNTICRIKL